MTLKLINATLIDFRFKSLVAKEVEFLIVHYMVAVEDLLFI